VLLDLGVDKSTADGTPAGFCSCGRLPQGGECIAHRGWVSKGPCMGQGVRGMQPARSTRAQRRRQQGAYRVMGWLRVGGGEKLVSDQTIKGGADVGGGGVEWVHRDQ